MEIGMEAHDYYNDLEANNLQNQLLGKEEIKEEQKDNKNEGQIANLNPDLIINRTDEFEFLKFEDITKIKRYNSESRERSKSLKLFEDSLLSDQAGDEPRRQSVKILQRK